MTRWAIGSYKTASSIIAQLKHLSKRLLCSWKAGVAQAPQLHCKPAQLKEPSRALHPMHWSFSPTKPSCTDCIHFMDSTNKEEHSAGSFSISLLFFRLKHCSPFPCSWGTMFSSEATSLRHFLQRYMAWGFATCLWTCSILWTLSLPPFTDPFTPSNYFYKSTLLLVQLGYVFYI